MMFSEPIEVSVIIYSIIGLIGSSALITFLLYINKKYQDTKIAGNSEATKNTKTTRQKDDK